MCNQFLHQCSFEKYCEKVVTSSLVVVNDTFMIASTLMQKNKPEPNSLDMQLIISAFSLVYSAYVKCAENEKYVGIA